MSQVFLVTRGVVHVTRVAHGVHGPIHCHGPWGGAYPRPSPVWMAMAMHRWPQIEI